MRTSFLLFCILWTVPALNAQADDFGMVLDVHGRVLVFREDVSSSADLGQTVFVGDRFELSKDAKLTIVSFQDCREWLITGPGQAKVRWTQIESSGRHQVQPGRRLPVCYSQEELEIDDPGVVGGLVLRGVPEDPVASLRREFESGEASNSTLVTLIMHDLANDEPKRAEPYLRELQRRAPNSPFVNGLARQFP